MLSVVTGVSWALLFGNPVGNVIPSLSIIVLLFLLFTNIRTTIYISLYSFTLMFLFFYKLNSKNMLNSVYAVDSVLGFLFFRFLPF
ncbi:hypothetical protein LEP1GSC133_2678 [Leptospira borgpetersenii serovar Pomona str. 200901868]|uniref:Uncharacterized protein n=1 Tax=Leptospira borgpetersenii serovar Pomona str. 200901868 TaxID=1192866 RepID=M6W5L8_LEPBO|nr:hypothetical protein LEP1GSC133_2678 [Leptospira borgpetersenii serovar Pomona str. 200901868]